MQERVGASWVRHSVSRSTPLHRFFPPPVSGGWGPGCEIARGGEVRAEQGAGIVRQRESRGGLRGAGGVKGFGS